MVAGVLVLFRFSHPPPCVVLVASTRGFRRRCRLPLIWDPWVGYHNGDGEQADFSLRGRGLPCFPLPPGLVVCFRTSQFEGDDEADHGFVSPKRIVRSWRLQECFPRRKFSGTERDARRNFGIQPVFVKSAKMASKCRQNAIKISNLKFRFSFKLFHFII